MRVRPVRREDSELLLTWRSDPGTRESAFQQGPIIPAEHEEWINTKLADPCCEIWIGELDGLPVGQVRLDVDATQLATIDITVAPGARGRGIGQRLLHDVLEVQSTHAEVLRAVVLAGNVASAAVFEREGFTAVSADARSRTYERVAHPAG